MARTPTIRPEREKVAARRSLRVLEERYRHEFMDEDQRQELRDRVLSLRWRLGR